jgi:ABC-type dipeptide/oligopeptide/nickel transport system permease subunit
MPQSHKRKIQKHPHQDFIPHEKKKGSAVPAAMAFSAIIAMGIAFFAAGASYVWLPVGLIAGLVIGYYAGKAMDKTFEK